MQKGGQELSQAMHEAMGHVVCARTQREHGKQLAARINGEPEPQDLLGAAQSGAEFVQLQVRKVKVAEAVLMQGLCMVSSASQPSGDSGFSEAEDPLGSGKIQSFGERREDHGDLVRRGFQAVEGVLRLEVKVVWQA
jgi:hypothetical protein